jgi:hypothetical protein
MQTIDTHDLARQVAVAMGTLDPVQQRVAVSLYRQLAEGFCHFVHFFADEKAAAQWIERYPNTFTLSIGDGFELARRRNRETLGAALEEAGR